MKIQNIVFTILCFIVSGLAFSQDYRPKPFNVNAGEAWGSAFENPGNAFMDCDFYASGTWQWGDGTKPSRHVGAEGSRQYACSQFQAEWGACAMPEAGVGTLLVRVGNKYGFMGEFINLKLQPHQTIYFLMNDASGGYRDNQGHITIRSNCRIIQ